jgi:hypothetical protein
MHTLLRLPESYGLDAIGPTSKADAQAAGVANEDFQKALSEHIQRIDKALAAQWQKLDKALVTSREEWEKWLESRCNEAEHSLRRVGSEVEQSLTATVKEAAFSAATMAVPKESCVSEIYRTMTTKQGLRDEMSSLRERVDGVTAATSTSKAATNQDIDGRLQDANLNLVDLRLEQPKLLETTELTSHRQLQRFQSPEEQTFLLDTRNGESVGMLLESDPGNSVLYVKEIREGSPALPWVRVNMVVTAVDSITENSGDMLQHLRKPALHKVTVQSQERWEATATAQARKTTIV